VKKASVFTSVINRQLWIASNRRDPTRASDEGVWDRDVETTIGIALNSSGEYRESSVLTSATIMRASSIWKDLLALII
jgi:hypothetical protein